MTCDANALRTLAIMDRSCAAKPPSRAIMLLDRVAESRCQPGQQVFPQLTGIADRDSMGRIAHVRGFYFAANAVLNVNAQANDAVSSYQILSSIWTSIFLEDVSGHLYWSDLLGGDLTDDGFCRAGRLVQWPYLSTGNQDTGAPPIVFPNYTPNGLPVNAGGPTQTVSASIYMPLVNPRPEASPFEGLVPLSALRDATNGGLRFRVGSSLVGANGPTPPTGVSIDHLERVDGTRGMDVYIDVVYLPSLVIDAGWSVDSYTLTDTSTDLWHPDRTTEYVWLRYHTNDDAQATNGLKGQLLANNWNGLTLSVGGMTLASGYTLNDLRERNQIQFTTDFQSATSFNNGAQDLPVTNPANRAQLLAAALLPHRGRETSAGGPVNVRFQTRDATFSRYLHRTVRCHDEARMSRIGQSARQRIGQIVSLDGRGRVFQGNKPSAFMPVLAK